MTQVEHRNERKLLAGWGATVVGGVVLIFSGFYGGWVVTLLGVGAAVAGFALVVLGSRRSAAARAPLRPGARSRVTSPPATDWLEEDLTVDMESPAEGWSNADEEASVPRRWPPPPPAGSPRLLCRPFSPASPKWISPPPPPSPPRPSHRRGHRGPPSLRRNRTTLR